MMDLATAGSPEPWRAPLRCACGSVWTNSDLYSLAFWGTGSEPSLSMGLRSLY